MANTNNLNIITQTPPSYLINKVKGIYYKSFTEGVRQAYLNALTRLRDLPSMDNLSRTDGLTNIISNQFFNYKAIRNDAYQQDPTRYGIYYTASIFSKPIGSSDWNPKVRKSTWAQELESRSTKAYDILRTYVLSNGYKQGSTTITTEAVPTNSINLKYSATVSFTNITQQNIIYSHYLLDDNRKFSSKIDNFQLPSDCISGLPSDDINNVDNTNTQTIEFTVEIISSWKVYPTIVIDTAPLVPPYLELNPNVVVRVPRADMTITKTIYDPDVKDYKTMKTIIQTYRALPDTLIDILNKEYSEFRKNYYYPASKSLQIPPKKNPVYNDVTCQDDCGRSITLKIKSQIASVNEYSKKGIAPLSIATTSSPPPASLPDFTIACKEVDPEDNSSNPLKCKVD